ncbi:MAG: YmfQ family protein [Fibrobacter sp.]|nr:YmfQ family protein [Fibrobacter sp.]
MIRYYLQLRNAINTNTQDLIEAIESVQGITYAEAESIIEHMQEEGIKEILKPDKTRWEFNTREEAENEKLRWNEAREGYPDEQATVKQEEIEEKKWILESLEALKTGGVFPKIYEGFRETEELAKAEDSIAEILKECVIKALNDRNIETASEEKISEWEAATGTEPAGTIEERRESVREAIKGNKPFNESALKALVDKIAGVDVLGISIDETKQEIALYQTGNGEQGTGAEEMQVEMATRVAHEILAEIPQALRCYGETRREQSKTIIINHGKTTTIYAKTEGIGISDSEEEPNNEGYIYLTFDPYNQTEYDISPGEISFWTAPLMYVKDESHWYNGSVTDLFNVNMDGPGRKARYEVPVESYDAHGNKTTGEIYIEQQTGSDFSVRNLTGNVIKCAYVKVKIPETIFYFRTDKQNQTMDADSSYDLHPVEFLADFVYALTWSCPWGIEMEPYDRAHVTEFKLYDSEDNEIPYTPTESVYMAKSGYYVKFINGSGSSITAAYVKFKFPWPTLAQ